MLNNVLKNRYQILEKIGGGGMAIVYKAKDTLLNRNVAIKVLKSSLTENIDFIKRFNNEAKSIASLSHVNVIPVYDIGEEKGTYYIVMEYVDGLTLDKFIHEKGKLDVDESINFALQICSAMKHAHYNGVIHRDIKPENVLLADNNVAKVVDFGISKTSTTTTMTQSGIVMGSVQYISPEQAKGESSDQRSDIYSFGITFYEMLTGILPFNADNAYAIALKHIQDEAIPPKEINKNIPDEINNIIMKSIEKNPVFRYQNTSEIIIDLKEFQINSYDNKTSKNSISKTRQKEDSVNKNKSDIKSIFKNTNYIIFLLILGIGFVGLLFYKTYITLNEPKSQSSEVNQTYETYIMKDFEGMDIEKVKETLEEDEWEENYILIEEVYDDTIPKNQIISQNIEKEQSVKLNYDTIKLIVSSGPNSDSLNNTTKNYQILYTLEFDSNIQIE
jgi:serine/threonine-protein kinase